MTHLRVLNLGAGVQSTAIYLMMIDGEIPAADIAIFADVKEEPKAVYDHLQRLKEIGGPEIVTVTAGEKSLGENLISGVNSTGQRHISIPTYLAIDGEKTALGRRQCTSEYKIKPIEREIRERMGAVGRPLKKGKTVTQVFGLSFDEPRRVERVRAQFHGRTGWSAEFPLFDDMMTRGDCLKYLSKRWPHPVPRSACVFCPFHSDDEWLRIKNEDPEAWQRAIEIDRAIRLETSACVRGMNAEQFLHRSCQPLELVELKVSPPDTQRRFLWSDMDCEGMCGV
jgi:hypothetical protein